MRAVLAALLVVAAAPADLPRYAVEPGTELVRKYASKTQLESEPMKMFLDGEEVPSGGHGEVRLKVESSRTIELTDGIEAALDGRPTRFVRTLDAIADASKETSTFQPAEGEAQSKENERERTTALVGRQVRFSWKPDDEEYATAYVDEKGDEELLEGLVGDVDWIAALPAKAVEVDAEWTIDPKLLLRLQHPGGRLHLRVEGEERDEAAEAFQRELDESLDGEARLTWRGVREEDGRELGVFALAAEVHADARAETEEPPGARETKIEFEYEGELYWDMKRGHLAGYEVGARIECTFATEREAKGADATRTLRQVFELTGTVENRLEVEARKP